MKNTLTFAFLRNFGIPIREGECFQIQGYMIFIDEIDYKSQTVTYIAAEFPQEGVHHDRITAEPTQ